MVKNANKKTTNKISTTKNTTKKNNVKKVESEKKTENVVTNTQNLSVLERGKSYTLVYVLFVVGIIISVVLAEYFTNKKVDDIVLSQLNYFETASTDYKAYYVNNPFYTDKYYTCTYGVDKDNICVNQYLNYINVNFNYYTNYSSAINGKYSYYVKGTLKVYEPGNEDNVYWAPTYDLSDKETVDFNQESSYRIQKSLKFNYQKYLDIYNNYKSKSSVSTNAKFYIELIIVNDGEYPGLDSIRHDANLKMEIPLSDAMFKIKLSNSVLPEEQSFKSLENNESERVFSKIIAMLCWIFAVFLAFALFIVYRTLTLREGEYVRKLRKILNVYDSIIVNVDSLPVIEDLSVINVSSFEELVDAQMEVRLPINFKEDPKKRIAKFIIVRNNLAWVYTLKEGKSDENKN